jgi:tetratricopeptide (TPR) repeat protein
VSCYLVTNDIIKNKPDNAALLEMQAVSLESMGALEKASETYNTLLKITSNNYHAYKLAGLQYAMKKYDLAYITIKKANELPDDGMLEVNFQVNKNYNQNVSLKAAILYLEGLIAQSLDKGNEAKLCFENAVKLFPDFILAKSKLETLIKQE